MTAAQIAILAAGGLVASLVILICLVVDDVDLVTMTPARVVPADDVPRTERLLLGDQHGATVDIALPTGRTYISDTPAPLVVDSPPSARGLIPVRDITIITVPSCSYCRDGERPLRDGRPCAWCGRGTPTTDEGASQVNILFTSTSDPAAPLPPRNDEPIYRQVLVEFSARARHGEAEAGEQVTA